MKFINLFARIGGLLYNRLWPTNIQHLKYLVKLNLKIFIKRVSLKKKLEKNSIQPKRLYFHGLRNLELNLVKHSKEISGGKKTICGKENYLLIKPIITGLKNNLVNQTFANTVVKQKNFIEDILNGQILAIPTNAIY